jgi:transketolase
MNDLNFLAKSIRLLVLDMINKSKASHIASAFSIVDILTILYSNFITNNKVSKSDTTKFILSKGHAGVAVYATLSIFGYINKEDLNEYYQNGSRFSGHISSKGVNGVELSTGSLGHGAGVAAGIAYGYKLNESKGKIYVLVGDGECNEGSIWEMAMFASHKQLNNLVLIVDFNNIQSLGFTKDIINIDNLDARFQSFGWEVRVVDGHDFYKLSEVFSIKHDKPLCVIAKTIKGKGVSFMENNNLWHYRDPQGAFYELAKKEISEK